MRARAGAGCGDELRLDIDALDLCLGKARGQNKRDDAGPCAGIEDLRTFAALHKMRQEHGVDGKAQTAAALIQSPAAQRQLCPLKIVGRLTCWNWICCHCSYFFLFRRGCRVCAACGSFLLLAKRSHRVRLAGACSFSVSDLFSCSHDGWRNGGRRAIFLKSVGCGNCRA